MMRIRMHVAAAVALVLLLSVDAFAQDRYMRMAREVDRPRVLHEALVLPEGTSHQAIVTFRIPNALLVFVRRDDRFEAEPAVTVAVYRRSRQVAEQTWRDRHEAASFEATQRDTVDVEGRVAFRLEPGRYTYQIRLDDVATGTAGRLRGTPFVVPEPDERMPAHPFFARLHERADGRLALKPANVGGGVPFGERFPVVIPVRSVEYAGERVVERVVERDVERVVERDADLAYRLYRVRSDIDRRDAGWKEDYERRAGDELIREGRLAIDEAPPYESIDASCLCVDAGGAAAARLVEVDLHTERLENGAYLLEVGTAQSASGASTQFVFETVWRDMPLSLYDHEVAIRNLEFIESREQIREMLRGSREERIERFEAYWKARDPSPDTPYNELMTEYYRRIDAAADRFRTGRTPYPDGLRTDAARVYVVHGPPDDISSSFPSSGGVEQVWTYPGGRRFVFRAASSLDALDLIEERGPTGPPANGEGF